MLPEVDKDKTHPYYVSKYLFRTKVVLEYPFKHSAVPQHPYAVKNVISVFRKTVIEINYYWKEKGRHGEVNLGIELVKQTAFFYIRNAQKF